MKMLVITRKNQERIRIGQDVEVIVLSVQGQRVKLGIVAPIEQTICRPQMSKPPVRLSLQAR
jgi:carbon storage regulator